MSPNRSHRSLGPVALCAVALLTTAAHADLTLVQTTTISNPQITAALQSMTPQQRQQVQTSGNPFFQNGPQITTIYTHGQQSRLDYGAYTVITNLAKKQVLTLNRHTHTYSSRPLPPPSGNGFGNAVVRDLHQSKTILGHTAHHYLVSTPSVGGSGSQLQADIWAAADLAQPVSSLNGGTATGALQSLLRRVKGLPLQSTIVIAGSPVGTVTARSVSRSVSTKPVSASVFALPAGYKPGEVGGAAGQSPMGGGFGQ